MPRYATIMTADDGAEIVSAIGEFEGSQMPRSAGRVEEVAPGVLIGMVRGGPVGTVAGFGFPRQGLDPAAVMTATAMLRAAGTPAADVKPPKAARARLRKKPARKAAKARTSGRAPASGAAVDG